jgi:hypothetical protein
MSLKLNTWDEFDTYLKKHLKPIKFGPKGQPIYSYDDMLKLDIIWPDEKEEELTKEDGKVV